MKESSLMDVTERKIPGIVHEAGKPVLSSLRGEGIEMLGIDFIRALRHSPGCTQAKFSEIL